MKSLEKMALEEIGKHASAVDAKLYDAKANVMAIKHTLMHAAHGMNKEDISELMSALHKVIASVDESKASVTLIEQWSNSLKEAN